MQKADGYENFMGFYQKRIPADLSRSQQYLIAFILPTLLSLIYMYGINVDSVNINLGLKLDDANPRVVSLAQVFQ